MPPKHPTVYVHLTDHDGNAFMILGVCISAARKAGIPSSEIQEFVEEATAKDYDALIQTVMRWFATD
jgi:hypothetical protein